MEVIKYLKSLQSRMDESHSQLQHQFSLLLSQVQQLGHSMEARFSELSTTHSSSSSSGFFFDAFKMKIPQFCGNHPTNWILKIKLFFKFHQIPDDAKIALAGLRMEGLTALWYQCVYKSDFIKSWANFAFLLRCHFGTSSKSVQCLLSNLSQTGSLEDFFSEFDNLASLVPDLEYFVAGLKVDLRSEIRLQYPMCLLQVMSLAYDLKMRQAVKAWKKLLVQNPLFHQGVRSFLGHAGFYRRFIKDFAKIAKPLSQLLMKVTDFVFDEACLTSFNVLMAPNWNLLLDKKRSMVSYVYKSESLIFFDIMALR